VALSYVESGWRFLAQRWGDEKLVERQTLIQSPIAGESGGLTSSNRAARNGAG